MSADDLFMQRLQHAGGQQDPSPNPEIEGYGAPDDGLVPAQHPYDHDGALGDSMALDHSGADSNELPEQLGINDSFSSRYHLDQAFSADGQVLVTTIQTACAHIVTSESGSDIQTNVTLPDGQMISLNAGQVPTIVYAAFDFVRMVDGQVTVREAEELMLLDESNQFWWLVLKDTGDIGYIPADNIETCDLRRARLNRDRNVELVRPIPQDRPLPVSLRPSSKKARGINGIRFAENIIISVNETYHLDDYIDYDDEGNEVHYHDDEGPNSADDMSEDDDDDEDLEVEDSARSQATEAPHISRPRRPDDLTGIQSDNAVSGKVYPRVGEEDNSLERDGDESPLNEMNAEANLALNTMALAQQHGYGSGSTVQIPLEKNRSDDYLPDYYASSMVSHPDDDGRTVTDAHATATDNPNSAARNPPYLTNQYPDASIQRSDHMNDFNQVYELDGFEENDFLVPGENRFESGSPNAFASSANAGVIAAGAATDDDDNRDAVVPDGDSSLIDDNRPFEFIVAYHIESASDDPAEFAVADEQPVLMYINESFADVLPRVLAQFNLPTSDAKGVGPKYRLLAYIDGFNFGISLAQDEHMYTLLEYVTECMDGIPPEECLRFILKEDTAPKPEDIPGDIASFGHLVSEPPTPSTITGTTGASRTDLYDTSLIGADSAPGGPSASTGAIVNSSLHSLSSPFTAEDSMMETMNRINEHLPNEQAPSPNHRRSVFDEAFGLDDDGLNNSSSHLAKNGVGSRDHQPLPETSAAWSKDMASDSLVPDYDSDSTEHVYVTPMVSTRVRPESKSFGAPSSSAAWTSKGSRPMPLPDRPAERDSHIQSNTSTSDDDAGSSQSSMYDSASSSPADYVTPETSSRVRSPPKPPPRPSTAAIKEEPPRSTGLPSLASYSVVAPSTPTYNSMNDPTEPNDRPIPRVLPPRPAGRSNSNASASSAVDPDGVLKHIFSSILPPSSPPPKGRSDRSSSGASLPPAPSFPPPPPRPDPPSEAAAPRSIRSASFTHTAPNSSAVTADIASQGRFNSFSQDHLPTFAGRRPPLSVQTFAAPPSDPPRSIISPSAALDYYHIQQTSSIQGSMRTSFTGSRNSLVLLSPALSIDRFGQEDPIATFNPLMQNNLVRASVDMAPFQPKVDEDIKRRLSYREEAEHEARYMSQELGVGLSAGSAQGLGGSSGLLSPGLQSSMTSDGKRSSGLVSSFLNVSQFLAETGPSTTASANQPMGVVGIERRSSSPTPSLRSVGPGDLNSSMESTSTKARKAANRMSWNAVMMANETVKRRTSAKKSTGSTNGLSRDSVSPLGTLSPSDDTHSISMTLAALHETDEADQGRRTTRASSSSVSTGSPEFPQVEFPGPTTGPLAALHTTPPAVNRVRDSIASTDQIPSSSCDTLISSSAANLSLTPNLGVGPATTSTGLADSPSALYSPGGAPVRTSGLANANTNAHHQSGRSSNPAYSTRSSPHGMDPISGSGGSPHHRYQHQQQQQPRVSPNLGPANLPSPQSLPGRPSSQETNDDSDASVNTFVTSPVGHQPNNYRSRPNAFRRPGDSLDLSTWLTLIRGLQPLPEDQLFPLAANNPAKLVPPTTAMAVTHRHRRSSSAVLPLLPPLTGGPVNGGLPTSGKPLPATADDLVLDYLARFPDPKQPSGFQATAESTTVPPSHTGTAGEGPTRTRPILSNRNSPAPTSPTLARDGPTASSAYSSSVVGKLASASASALPLMGEGGGSSDVHSHMLPNRGGVPPVDYATTPPSRSPSMQGQPTTPGSTPLDVFLNYSKSISDRIEKIERELDDLVVHVVRAF
ncbi:protein phosphatase regulator [Dimargaris cristalligena]|nr:protein phosphatase regulator [Dimargaris cristalligena]